VIQPDLALIAAQLHAARAQELEAPVADMLLEKAIENCKRYLQPLEDSVLPCFDA
jgi:hypothetical protein